MHFGTETIGLKTEGGPNFQVVFIAGFYCTCISNYKFFIVLFLDN